MLLMKVDRIPGVRVIKALRGKNNWDDSNRGNSTKGAVTERAESVFPILRQSQFLARFLQKLQSEEMLQHSGLSQNLHIFVHWKCTE